MLHYDGETVEIITLH